MSRCDCICWIVSSATPTTISSPVPPMNWDRLETAPDAEDQQRYDRDRRQEERPGERDPRQDVVDVLRRARPGRVPGMNPPCFFMFSARSIGLKMIAV